MGRIGRPPKPTALKVLNGSAAHDPQRINREEPIPQGVLTMPADLTLAEQEVWRHVTASMPAGVITSTDRDIFRIYCQEVALEQKVRRMVGRSGILVRSEGHGLAKNPLLSVLRDHASLVRGFASDLGLTPSARTSIHAVKPTNDNSMAALMTPKRRTG